MAPSWTEVIQFFGLAGAIVGIIVGIIGLVLKFQENSRDTLSKRLAEMDTILKNVRTDRDDKSRALVEMTADRDIEKAKRRSAEDDHDQARDQIRVLRRKLREAGLSDDLRSGDEVGR